MAVDRVLPIGTKVVFDEDDYPFRKGDVGTVTDSEEEMDGVTHEVSNGKVAQWVDDCDISEILETPKAKIPFPTEKHFFPITFAEIIAGIAKGKYKEGQRFKTNAYKGSDRMIYAVISKLGTAGEPYLMWEDNSTQVALSHSIISDPWFIETEVTAESAQLWLEEEFTDASLNVELFDDGSATVEITEMGHAQNMIGLTVRQVEKLHYFLLTGNTVRDW